MKYLSLISLVILLASCTRPSDSHVEQTRAVLNEVWYNDESMGTDTLRTEADWHNRMHNGTECRFMPDGTFTVRLWWYGVSSGHFEETVGGCYSYNPKAKAITLFFHRLYADGDIFPDPIPMGYDVLRGLSQRSLPLWGIDEPDFILPAATCLKMKGEDEKGVLQVDLYAYNHRGEKVSFGKQSFFRNPLTTTEKTDSQ